MLLHAREDGERAGHSQDPPISSRLLDLPLGFTWLTLLQAGLAPSELAAAKCLGWWGGGLVEYPARTDDIRRSLGLPLAQGCFTEASRKSKGFKNHPTGAANILIYFILPY